MLIEVNDDFLKEIKQITEAMNITPGEYLENLYKNTQNLKDDLLEDKEDFSTFVEEYHLILNELSRHQENLLASVKEIDDTLVTQRVFEELIRLCSDDISVLSKLYNKYKEQNDRIQLI
ncbi:MAG: hypothetical protein RR548_06495 [Carnobacterium sp.]|uniref:hypothetical protein n=1 Tax=Carnobacterium sp. TaxID=48221 RepID=UPI002FCC811C